MRMQVPFLERKIQEEEAKYAQYELEWLMYTNPERLLKLKEKPQYGHLVFPNANQSLLFAQVHSNNLKDRNVSKATIDSSSCLSVDRKKMVEAEEGQRDRKEPTLDRSFVRAEHVASN